MSSKSLTQAHLRAADILTELYANLKEDQVLLLQMSSAIWRKVRADPTHNTSGFVRLCEAVLFDCYVTVCHSARTLQSVSSHAPSLCWKAYKLLVLVRVLRFASCPQSRFCLEPPPRLHPRKLLLHPIARCAVALPMLTINWSGWKWLRSTFVDSVSSTVAVVPGSAL